MHMDITSDDSGFKWLPKEIEQKAGLTRTSHVIGDSFARCLVVYETKYPGVYLTNYSRGRDLEAERMWLAFNKKNKQALINAELIEDGSVWFDLYIKDFAQPQSA